MRRTTGILLALTTAAATAGLVGCSLGGPQPDSAAAAVAQALARYDVAKVTFAGPDAGEAGSDVTSALGDLRRFPVKVGVDRVRTDGDTATARLTWTRSVAGRPWVTHAPMSLVKTGDTWRVVWKRTLLYPGLEPGQTLDAMTEPARRGDILGAGGRPIVKPRAVDRFGIDKTQVHGAAAVASARSLARLVDVDAQAFAKRVKLAGDKAFVEAITLRAGAPGHPSAQAVSSITGARVVPGEQSLAPTSDFAAPILGTVGQPTAELIKKSHGRLQVGDQVGRSGLQSRYETQLGGTPGVRIDLVGGTGSGAAQDSRPVFRAEPVAGKPLRTTLDLDAQTYAEQALAGTTAPSALVAIRPSTGDVLAAASGPAGNGYNTATYGRYAPGSTFKVVSSLALLRSGLTPDTMVSCPPTLTVDGKQFKNYSDYPASALGRIPFRTAIADSCNTAVIGQRGRLGRDSLPAAAAALGLGVDHDLGFPAYFGSAPRAASATERAADLIGQGKVQASPLAMATVAASVRKGSVVVPRLLVENRVDPSTPAEPLTSAEAVQLRTLMRGVVTQGSGRLLLDLPAPPVLAKTGTAEYGAKAPYKTHAWMIAIYGDLAVAVFVEDGASGSGTAGPILKQFLQAMG